MDRIDIELRHLRYFVAVAEEASFTRAAARLHLAQPALSQQVRQLEERVGTRLLERSPRVALTPAGASLFDAAQRVIKDVHLAADTARRISAGKRSVLNVGLASSAALTAFPIVLERYRSAHPDVDIRLHEMHSGAQVEALTRGALDIAVVREPVVASGIASGIASRELVREPFVLLLPPRHALRRHRTPSLSRCAADPFILFRRAVSPTLHDQIHAICRESGFVPHVVHEASEWHTIMALVAAGAGVSIAPASVAVLRIRGATVRPLRSTTGRAVLYLCYEPRAASTEARQLAAFVQRAMRRTRTRTEA